MKSIHIRDVDPVVYGKIKRLAEMHHRSVQGELRAILADVARRAPDDVAVRVDELVTVSTGNGAPWRREDIYDDDAR